MQKTQKFETYFNDKSLSTEQLERMQLTRKIIHEIYPDVHEKVSYAMPNFQPKGATKANQTLLMLGAAKKWLGVYALPGFNSRYQEFLVKEGIEFGKGSIKVPYSYPEDKLRNLLEKIIDLNLTNFMEEKK